MMHKGLAIAAALLFGVPADAQEHTPKGPAIAADGQVTFSLAAPDAHAVAVRGDWPGGTAPSVTPMSRGPDGTWTATVGPIAPDLWSYAFVVDGVRLPDPRNLHLDLDKSSKLLVPGTASADYEVRDVPHGSVATVWYPARTLGLPAKRVTVYTPPGYQTGSARYPVLYLTANYETWWLTFARAATILDNLIASGRAVPMIVVMPSTVPDAAAAPEAIDEPLPSTKARPSRFAPAPNPHGLMQTLPPYFDGGTSVADDLVPFVDARYRTVADRDHRAIVGLSASGAAAFYTAMRRTGIFAWTGGFSAGWPSLPGAWADVPAPADAVSRFPDVEGRPDTRQNVDTDAVARLLPDMTRKANFRLVALYVGANDPLVEADKRMRALLDRRGVRYVSIVRPAEIHDWRFWMWCLKDFAPRLFRAEPVR